MVGLGGLGAARMIYQHPRPRLWERPRGLLGA